MIERVPKHCHVTPVARFVQWLFKVRFPYFIKPDVSHDEPHGQKHTQNELCELCCSSHHCVISLSVVIVIHTCVVAMFLLVPQHQEYLDETKAPSHQQVYRDPGLQGAVTAVSGP